ncbi:xaa-Pro aminopeptidase 3 isoform X3 [Oncorhynchus mykiss]|nr:xaa-Pro aminopeptidase 3 isoform X3 [Oncorhynchus mykiss]
MLPSPNILTRSATQLVSYSKFWSQGNLSAGHLWCPCRNVSVKPEGWKPQKVPPRYLGQLSPFTHPHLIKNGEVTPGLTQTEFDLRRQRLASLIEVQADRLGPTASSNKHLVIVLSHPIRYMTNDIPYPFHQNQDFLYLTGILEPDSALVLCGTGRPDQAILFVPRRDPARELWDGPRSGKDGAAALTGVERVHCTEELGLVLKSLKGSTVWYDGSKPCHPGLHQTHVRPLLEGGPMVRSLRPLTHSLRALKSPAEVALMKEAGRITAQAFKKTMGMSQGDIDEALLYAKFDFECRAHGANFLAYPPVVAGGNRANTLHYINNNQIVKNGEMVLLDGGCEYFCYVSDITRTWPVNGKFSPAQAELYEGVLEVQKACLSLCSPGVSLDHIYSTMLALLGRQLKQLGIVKGSTSDADALK